MQADDRRFCLKVNEIYLTHTAICEDRKWLISIQRLFVFPCKSKNISSTQYCL